MVWNISPVDLRMLSTLAKSCSSWWRSYWEEQRCSIVSSSTEAWLSTHCTGRLLDSTGPPFLSCTTTRSLETKLSLSLLLKQENTSLTHGGSYIKIHLFYRHIWVVLNKLLSNLYASSDKKQGITFNLIFCEWIIAQLM